MTLQGYQFDKAKVTPEADAQLYSYLAQASDNKVISGLTATATGLNVYVSAGKALVQGRLIENSQQMQLTAQANKTGYVCITIDLTQTNTSTGSPGTSNYVPVNNQLRLELVETLNRQDLYAGGFVHTFQLYTYKSTASTVTLTNFSTSREIKQPLISTSFAIGYGASVNARRIGDIVEILFLGQNANQIPGGTTMNEKIPQAFRPADVTSIDFLAQGRHLDTYYYFDPNGTISYQGDTLPANSYLRGVRTYFTNNPWPSET